MNKPEIKKIDSGGSIAPVLSILDGMRMKMKAQAYMYSEVPVLIGATNGQTRYATDEEKAFLFFMLKLGDGNQRSFSKLNVDKTNKTGWKDPNPALLVETENGAKEATEEEFKQFIGGLNARKI